MSNLYSVHHFINNTQALRVYLDKINTSAVYNDFNKIQTRLIDTIDKLIFQLKDIVLSIKGANLTSVRASLNLIKQSLPTYTTIEQLKSINELLDVIDLDYLDRISLGYMNESSDDYYYNNTEAFDIPDEILQSIRISMSARPLNLFFPDADSGYNIPAMSLSEDRTYANSERRIESCRQLTTRTIKGSLKGSHISNNFFDAMLVCPQVDYRLQSDELGKYREPIEKTLIKNYIKYLRKGGLYICMLPATRVDDNLALWLSKALSDNTIVFKLNDTPLQKIIIIGQKQITSTVKESLYAKLKRIDYDTLDDYTILEPNMFVIPSEELTLEFFRGSRLDTSDVLEALNVSMMDDFLNKQTQPLVVKDQSPLLPFNIGQVGLVLTSGCLDGVVEEMDGVYHVIKGMTTKITDTKTEVSDDNTQIKSTETISNQVKINVFTADGKFISLG